MPNDLFSTTHIYNKWLRPIQTNRNTHMEVSLHVGVIAVRTQFFVLIYEFILFPLIIVCINYNYHLINWISNDLIYIELESVSKTYMIKKRAVSL